MKKFIESILPKYNITSAKVFVQYNLVLIKEINNSDIRLCFNVDCPDSLKRDDERLELKESSKMFLIEHNIKISDLISLEEEVISHYKALGQLVRED